MAEDQDPENKKDWSWADQLPKPIYRKFREEQWFKIVDPETVFSIRDDATASAVGVSAPIFGDAVERILAFDPCTKEEFNAALARVMDLVEPFLLDIMYRHDR